MKLRVGAARWQLRNVGLARVVHDAVQEAGKVQELDLDDERAPGFVLRFEVEDAELRACDERRLLGREQREGRDAAVTLEREEIVEQRAGELGVVRKDATEDEVVFEVGEHG